MVSPGVSGDVLDRMAEHTRDSVTGEMAFLDGRPRAATIRALTDGDLLRLSFEAFEALSARHPELGRAILLDLGRILAARLRQANEVIARVSH